MDLAKVDGNTSSLPDMSRSPVHDQAVTGTESKRGRSFSPKAWVRDLKKHLPSKTRNKSTSQTGHHRQLGGGDDTAVSTHVSDQRAKGSESTRKSCLELAIISLKGGQPDNNIPSDVDKATLDTDVLVQNIHRQMENLETSQTRIKNVIANTIRYILLFRGLGNSAASFDPTKASRVAVNGMFGILETILLATTLDEQKIQDMCTVASKLAHWANIEKLYLTTQQPRVASELQPLETSIVELYKSFLKLEVAIPSKKGNVVYRIFAGIDHVAKAPMDAPSWNKLIGDFTRVSLLDCENKLSALKERFAKRKDILEWLSDVDPLMAHEQILQRTHVADRYQQCGEWLLKKKTFENWSSSDYSKEYSVLWLHGTVGTGKTTVFSRVVQWHLERSSLFPEHRFAYAYCSRAQDFKSKSSHIAILNSLLRQASFNQVTGEISENILCLFNDRGKGGKATPLKIETQISEHLTRILMSGVRLRVMIDALDECDKPMDLLAALAEVYKQAPENLEILITSRHEVRVKEIVEFTECQEFGLNTSLTNADMENFINLEVRRKNSYPRLLNGKYPELEERLINVLNRKANGMFRWVELQLSLFLNPNKALKHHKDVETKLKSLETGSVAGVELLNQAYADVFERNTPAGEIERGHATKLYRILLCCEEELTTAALIEAVGFDENKNVFGTTEEFLDTTVTQEYILGLCRDFVIESEFGVLQFAHVSVKDYLQGEESKNSTGGQYSMLQCHQQMAKLCLSYVITSTAEVSTAEVVPRSFRNHYAPVFLGKHCSQVSKELRASSGISKILANWMIFGKGRNLFATYLERIRAGNIIPCKEFWYDPDSILSTNNSAIYVACAWNLVEIIQQLFEIDSGCINLRNEEGSTPLFVACQLGREETVKFLLDLIPDLSVEAIGYWSRNFSALHIVADLATAELLLRRHPELVRSVDSIQRTPLYDAIPLSSASTKLIKLYIKYGADVNKTDSYGDTPLHAAARSPLDNLEIVRVLVKDAKANAQNDMGETPLHLAARLSHSLEKIRIIAETTTLDLSDGNGMTALLCAATCDPGNINVIEYLLSLGASILSTNHKKQGILHLTVDPQVIEYLMQGGLRLAVSKFKLSLPRATQALKRSLLEATDDKGDTPLLAAPRDRNRWCARVMSLVKVGADVNITNMDEQNVLHFLMAADLHQHYYEVYQRSIRPESDFAEAVQWTVSKGCNINQKDSDGNLPIHNLFKLNTAFQGMELNDGFHQMHFAKCKLACLVEAGVYITCPDREGKTMINHFQVYLRQLLKMMERDSFTSRTRKQLIFLVLKFITFLEHCLELQCNTDSPAVDENAMEEIKQAIQHSKMKLSDNEAPLLFRESVRNEIYNRTIEEGKGELQPVVFSWSDSLEWPADWPRYDKHVL